MKSKILLFSISVLLTLSFFAKGAPGGGNGGGGGGGQPPVFYKVIPYPSQNYLEAFGNHFSSNFALANATVTGNGDSTHMIIPYDPNIDPGSYTLTNTNSNGSTSTSVALGVGGAITPLTGCLCEDEWIAANFFNIQQSNVSENCTLAELFGVRSFNARYGMGDPNIRYVVISQYNYGATKSTNGCLLQEELLQGGYWWPQNPPIVHHGYSEAGNTENEQYNAALACENYMEANICY
jgi:hypothetical protein